MDMTTEGEQQGGKMLDANLDTKDKMRRTSLTPIFSQDEHHKEYQLIDKVFTRCQELC